LSPSIQQRLFDEVLDRGVQKELEEESAIINWSLEITDRLGSRLYALWNRTAGDCLLDSVLQVCVAFVVIYCDPVCHRFRQHGEYLIRTIVFVRHYPIV
jgi:uncharacterized membrane protein